ncbi:presequence translocated-associated motor subunit Pam17p, mitochondrial [[Candida] railenensis]|uniref:Presequence translocated-associated motor subunit PAM17 n=1 Tax=[Candida] railenensis TaxID=45579 RepID=A0A9P0QPP0_9ASCO|nr:presequence translocated-associated motor subunit Pam17p, mitochondrial [[Candida] railenensis]
MFFVGLKQSAKTGIFARNAARFNSTSGSPSSGMTWIDFFKLKKQNSRVNMVSSGFTSVVGSFVTLTALGNIEIDVEKPIMGLDPLMIMGGCVILGGAFGYVLGPFVGTPIFNMRNKALLQQFKTKDRQFFNHIKSKRVDPTSQSFSNPVPDYYGEKIYSLKDYKQWLRDCNAFRRKTKEFL